MKDRTGIARIIVTLTISAAVVALAGDSATNSPAVSTTAQMLEEINSQGSLLYELAWERHSADAKRHRKVILTTHDGMRNVSFTDKDFTVISLPALLPSDDIALSRYTSHYNSITERAADLEALHGQYDEPARVYRLLLHFGHTASKDKLVKKLSLLESLQKGTNVVEARRELSALSTGLCTLMKLDTLDEVKATVVPSLLDVPVPVNEDSNR